MPINNQVDNALLDIVVLECRSIVMGEQESNSMI